MLKFSIDNAGNTMGGNTTIADLAQFSFNDQDSDHLTIYEASDLLHNDWAPELAEFEMEYLLGIRATFKDGTKLNVSAWSDCCDGTGYCRQCHDGITRFSRPIAA